MSDHRRHYDNNVAILSNFLAALLIAGPLVFSGCERVPDERPAPPAATQPSGDELAHLKEYLDATAPAPRRNELPAGHPQIDQPPPQPSAQRPPRERPAPPSAADRKLTYTVPDPWVAEPTRSAMRQAQYRLPGPDDQADPGELAVFYFGPGGAGGVEANIERWRTQFNTPAGEPVPPDQVKRQSFTVNDLKVTLVEVRGRVAAGPMSAHSDDSAAADEQQLLAAIIETPDGPWFFKAVGPPRTMTHHRAAMLELLRSARYEPNAP